MKVQLVLKCVCTVYQTNILSEHCVPVDWVTQINKYHL